MTPTRVRVSIANPRTVYRVPVRTTGYRVPVPCWCQYPVPKEWHYRSV